uniref:HDC15089 n=1 Tax=Drosophila melanogaster TaxID=7227 RepID=Q6IJE4_DROME|nr:TPA_inf: HDC15089 [Drosophila melanogaster]
MANGKWSSGTNTTESSCRGSQTQGILQKSLRKPRPWCWLGWGDQSGSIGGVFGGGPGRLMEGPGLVICNMVYVLGAGQCFLHSMRPSVLHGHVLWPCTSGMIYSYAA